jgi:hypothetical protein
MRGPQFGDEPQSFGEGHLHLDDDGVGAVSLDGGQSFARAGDIGNHGPNVQGQLEHLPHERSALQTHVDHDDSGPLAHALVRRRPVGTPILGEVGHERDLPADATTLSPILEREIKRSDHLPS